MEDITRFFTSESVNEDGSVRMLSSSKINRKVFYLTNVFGDKLLKLSIKSEPRVGAGESHAQIKLIGYGIKRAHVWEDKPSDPRIERLPAAVEMTYHGAQKGEMHPKIHVKAQSGYRTLMNDSLELPVSYDMPVPLFSFEPGYKNKSRWGGSVKKRGHVLSTGNSDYVRVDFYLAGVNIDIGAFVNSMYFFNLFWTQDYLAGTKNHPLEGGKIIAPIQFFSMGEYMLVVRRSQSQYQGKPRLIFYSNKDYYKKLMGRSVAHKRADGSVQWTTMEAEDERLRRMSDMGR